jgi:Escherichia/Staphylococcus phage prohead protease
VLPDLEHRACLELRADRERIVGYAVVYGVRSRDLGGFVEVVKPQACAQLGDVVALFNHDANQVLGRTPATLQLRTDDRGLAFTLDPAPTQAGRDAFELVKRGDVQGASFGFRTKKDAWRQDAGVMVRELLDIELAEISLTAFPAYREADVTIARRSLLQAAKTTHGSPVKSIAWLQREARLRVT